MLFAQLGEFQSATTIGDIEKFVQTPSSRFPHWPTGLTELIATGNGRQSATPQGRRCSRSSHSSVGSASPSAEAEPALGDRRPPACRMDSVGPPASHRANQANHRIDVVVPAYARLADFVEKTYLPACRDSVGTLRYRRSEPPTMRFWSDQYTTTNLSPDQLHELGHAEMARNRTQMQIVMRKVGYEKGLECFLHIRENRPTIQEPDGRADPRAASIDRTRHHEGAAAPVRAIARDSAGDSPLRPGAGSIVANGRILSTGGGRIAPGIFFVNTSEPDDAADLHHAGPGVS